MKKGSKKTNQVKAKISACHNCQSKLDDNKDMNIRNEEINKQSSMDSYNNEK